MEPSSRNQKMYGGFAENVDMYIMENSPQKNAHRVTMQSLTIN